MSMKVFRHWTGFHISPDGRNRYEDGRRSTTSWQRATEGRQEWVDGPDGNMVSLSHRRTPVKKPLLCCRGFHASPTLADAIHYGNGFHAKGLQIRLVQLRGQVYGDPRKSVGLDRRVLGSVKFEEFSGLSDAARFICLCELADECPGISRTILDRASKNDFMGVLAKSSTPPKLFSTIATIVHHRSFFQWPGTYFGADVLEWFVLRCLGIEFGYKSPARPEVCGVVSSQDLSSHGPHWAKFVPYVTAFEW